MPEIQIFANPVEVYMFHNGVPVDQIDDGWGLVDVFEITRLRWVNPEGFACEFRVVPDVGSANTIAIPASGEGQINLPTPRRFRHHPATYYLTPRRNP